MRNSPWIQALLSIAVVALVLWHVPAAALWSAAREAQTIWFVPALAVTMIMLVVRYQKWRLLLAAAGVPCSGRDAARSLFCAYALSVVTPGKVGDFARCLFFPKPVRKEVLHLNAYERILDAWSVGTFAVLSLSLGLYRWAGILTAAVWIAGVPAVVSLPELTRRWACRTTGRKRQELLRAAETLSRVRTGRFAGWALLSTALDALIFYFALQALHPVAFKVAIISLPWVIIAGGLPISIGGIGAREGAAALVLTRYALPSAVAMDSATLLFVSTALLPAILGGVWLLAGKLCGARMGSGDKPVDAQTIF